MLLCIWFPSEPGFLTLNLLKPGVGYPHQGGLWDLVTSYSATQVAPTAHRHQEGLLHIRLGKFITLPWCPALPNLTLAESEQKYHLTRGH